ncbi:MAG: hypothetical protein P8130_12880 [Deltaproteobacteria bacterium]
MNIQLKILAVLSVLLLPYVNYMPTAAAANFDGSAPLLCAPIMANECDLGSPCQTLSIEDAGLPQFVVIDLDKKTIKPTPETGKTNITKIASLTSIDGKFILQGAEDGRKDEKDGLGWTISIDQETGKLVMAAAGEQVAFVIYGACTIR